MEYRNRAKNRKLKRIILNTIESFKFKWINLSLEWKIVSFWIIIVLSSLFMNWIETVSGNIYGNSFSEMVWSVWYILLFFIGISFFSVFSYSKKEKIKLSIDLHVKDYNIIMNSGFSIILFSITSLRYIEWLQKIGSDFIYGKWPIIGLIWGIIILIGWYIIKRKASKHHDMMYVNEIRQLEDENSGDTNMKLPF